MGNIQNLDKNHFFHKLKQTSSYKDFVIKMNQLLSRSSTVWTFNKDSLNSDDIQQHKEKVENFFIYATEFIYERSVKKQNPTKEELQQVSTFLQILQHLMIQITFSDKKFFDELFFYRISKESSIKVIKDEQNEQFELKIDDEENYQGKDEHIPIFLKLFYSCIKLFSKNNFAIYYKSEVYDDNHKLWSSSLQREHIIQKRNNLIQLLLTMIQIEYKLNSINEQKGLSCMYFLEHYEDINKIIPQIIYSALYYEENGIFPYSAYFYKDQLESNLQTSLLSLQLSNFVLKNNSEEIGDGQNPKIIIVDKFLENKSMKNNNKQNVFDNQVFVNKVLKKIIKNLNTFFEKDDTILPNSFLESPLNQEIILLLLLFVIRSEQCQKSLFQQKSHYNILMNLIIILDQVQPNFNNAIYYCTCAVLLQLSATVIKLNEESSYNYQFKNSPIISGKTTDFLVCSLISLIKRKLDHENFCQSIQTFASILQNISNHDIVLSESSSLQILSFISELENYKEILRNLNQIVLSYSMLNLIQNILNNNFLKNIDLQSFLFLYRDTVHRLIQFGNNKSRLGLILYEDKVDQIEGKINLELEEEELNYLDNIYEQIQNIKSQFSFEQLEKQIKHIEEHLIEYKEKKDASYFEKSHKIRNLLKKQKKKITLLNFNAIMRTLQEKSIALHMQNKKQNCLEILRDENLQKLLIEKIQII